MAVIMSKIFTLPSSGSGGTLASDLEVGESVFLNVDGVATEFLIVHQGNPDSSMYDSSCDGVWLLMQDIYATNTWGIYYNTYKDSTIDAYLNDTFVNLFDANVKSAIKTVKIPYVNGTGKAGSVASGSNGLSAQVFLLSGYEVGFIADGSSVSSYLYFPFDGACLSYFSGASNSKRIAKLNGTATNWWLRSPFKNNETFAWCITTSGSGGNGTNVANTNGVRPALILPSNALFYSDTKEFIGVE